MKQKEMMRESQKLFSFDIQQIVDKKNSFISNK
jgi:hypothetical protein